MKNVKEIPMEFKVLKISDIQPDIDQPRQHFDEQELEQLALSIKDKGILNPIVVEKFKGNKYLIIDGERRYRASKELNLKKVPCKIISEDLSPTDRNVLRFHYQETQKQWSYFEKAEAIKKIKEDLSISNEDIARILRIDRSTVYRLMDLFNLSSGVKKRLIKEKVPFQIVDSLNIIRKAIPVEITSKYPDYMDILITKYKNKSFKGTKGLTVLAKLIRYGEYKLVNKFLENDKYTLQEIVAMSNVVENDMISSIISRSKLLTRDLNVIIKNDIEISGSEKAFLNELSKIINNVV